MRVARILGVCMGEFGGLLARAGLSKRELSRVLGLYPSTVTRWGDNPPQYARAYLELRARIREVLK